MGILPGLVLALSLALGGRYLSELVGISWMGLPKSPISAIMMAILLGILIRNTIGLSTTFQPGVRFGLFLGTAVHETAQVAGAGLVYQQFYNDPQALDVATVTKLVRNLGMLIVIPLMSIVYHRNATDMGEVPKWWTMIPLFVVGFACMSLLRTIGDLGEPALGFLQPDQWQNFVTYTKKTAEICLAIAMASVGLGTSIKGLRSIGMKPLAVGLFSALLVGGVSAALISILY